MKKTIYVSKKPKKTIIVKKKAPIKRVPYKRNGSWKGRGKMV